MSELHYMLKCIIPLQWLAVQFYYCLIYWLFHTIFSLQFSLIKICYCHHSDKNFGFQDEYAIMIEARKRKKTSKPTSLVFSCKLKSLALEITEWQQTQYFFTFPVTLLSDSLLLYNYLRKYCFSAELL